MKQILLVLFLSVGWICTKAQSPGRDVSRRISVKEFVDAIAVHPEIQKSAEWVAAKQLDVEVARISPDPSITVGNVSGDISGLNMPHQWFAGLDYTIETGGKRRQRVLYAKTSENVARAQHMVYVNQFYQESLLLYQKCWMMEQRLVELNQYDSLLVSLTEVDSFAVLRIRITRRENELHIMALRNLYDEHLDELQDLVRHKIKQGYVLPAQPVWDERDDDSKNLLLDQHPEWRLKQTVAQLQNEEILLEQRDQVPDISLSVGNNFITEATNPEAPSPRYNAITATLSIPLRFSALKGAEKKRHIYMMQQVEDAEVKAVQDLEEVFAKTEKELHQLSEAVRHISSIIHMQMKLIKAIPSAVGSNVLNEWLKLEGYREQRWETYTHLCEKKAFLYVRSEAEPHTGQKTLAGNVGK